MNYSVSNFGSPYQISCVYIEAVKKAFIRSSSILGEIAPKDLTPPQRGKVYKFSVEKYLDGPNERTFLRIFERSSKFSARGL
jgi:hypothetical protein